MLKSKIIISGIALLSLTIGISGFYIWNKLSPSLEPFDDSHIRGLQVIGYCELRNKTTEYDGKVVKIDTTLDWFEHGYFLVDPACGDATDTKYLDSARTAVTFESDHGKELLNFLRQYHSSGRPFHVIRTTAVGRFTHRATANYSDSIQDRTPYRFELYSLENVQPVDPPNE